MCHLERVNPAADVLSEAFDKDPVVAYLISLPLEARLAYLPSYFVTMLTAAGLSDAIIAETGNWASCAVLVPPGKSVDNFWTVIPAGIFRVLWRIGMRGCRVGETFVARCAQCLARLLSLT
jgi:hypothetical protein